MEQNDVAVSVGNVTAALGVYFSPNSDHPFGLTNSGRIELQSFAHGERRDSASVRFVPGERGEWLVGDPAESHHAKGLMFGSPVRYLDHPAPIVVSGHPSLDAAAGLSPAAMLAHVIRRAVRRFLDANPAERRVESIVMTAPLGYSDLWAKHMHEACEIAGVKLAEIVTDPMAILTYYGWHHQFLRYEHGKPGWETGDHILIADWGAESLRLTAMRIRDIQPERLDCQLLAAIDLPRTGALHIDERVGRYITRRFSDPKKYRGKPKEIAQILRSTRELVGYLNESLKHREDTAIGWNIGNPILFATEVDPRDYLRILAGESEERAVNIPEAIERACADIQGVAGRIDHLLNVGGGAHLPILNDTARSIFGESIHVYSDANPELLAVQGATLRATQLRGNPHAGPFVTLESTSLFASNIELRCTDGRKTMTSPWVSAGLPQRAGLAYKRTLKPGRGHGDTLIHCIQRPEKREQDTSRRVAGVNLGPIASDATVTCDLEIIGEDMGRLTISCDDDRFGPIPVALPPPRAIRT